MAKSSKRLTATLPSTSVIDMEDAKRFSAAADKYTAANTASQAVAKAKLEELGFIDKHGRPTKPYR
jgi:hypothetical protein